MDMKVPRWKRREFTRNAVLAGLGLAGISAVGCTTTTAVTGGTLTVSMSSDPTTLNPLLEKKFGHYACVNIFDRIAT